jgi:hypothetical protein
MHFQHRGIRTRRLIENLRGRLAKRRLPPHLRAS